MSETINLREIEQLPIHGGEGIPCVVVAPAERDALVAAVRAAKALVEKGAEHWNECFGDEGCQCGILNLEIALRPITDEEPTDG